MTRLHFTIGPVQGFVAQARRTKDFWSGSFLLSYLAGIAMQEVINNSGEIVFPVVKEGEGKEIIDPLLKAISEQRGLTFGDDFPRLGSLPNRFMAEVDKGFDPNQCVKAVMNAWKGIAAKIWDRYLAPVASYGNGTEEIWQRQVDGFWDISWVEGEEADLLDRLKNWRHHLLTEEPGDKCTLMGNLQELSGYVRKNEKEKQEKFWRKMRDSVGLDLRDDERLCAVALIKRLFPRLFGNGKIRIPSTSYLAAVPWLLSVSRNRSEGEKAIMFAEAAGKKLQHREDPSLFGCFQDTDSRLHPFLSLDGTCLFRSVLESGELSQELDGERCKGLIELLGRFKTGPAPFYVLLLMDGDHLGKLLANNDSAKVSGAIKQFSGQVDAIVKNYNGLTIYAGGDDVLALLPLDQALTAATMLRKKYQQAFQDVGIEKATISAAIVYAHHHAPLKQVIAWAHKILDDEAKEKTGRDALAVTVWKTGGAVLNWSAPWELSMGTETVAVEQLIKSLVDILQGKKLTNSWIYNMRKLFLNVDREFAIIPENVDAVKLMTAELMDSREIDFGSRDEAERMVGQLITLCSRQFHDSDGKLQRKTRELNFDGAMLVKFLATKGAER